MKHLLLTTLLFTYSVHAVAAQRSAEPQVAHLGCEKAGDQAVMVNGTKVQLAQPLLEKNPKLICQQVNFAGLSLLSIQYATKTRISYSGQLASTRFHDVYRLQDGKATLQFSDMVEKMNPIWMAVNGDLVMRNEDNSVDGVTALLNGYVFVPGEGKFEDFTMYAHDNGWKIR